ncbi:hypothetical protein JCM8547_002175 [Rhodosporidiobolus lusitaniae]
MASPPPAPLHSLPDLLTQHSATLTSLYTSLSAFPTPLIEAHFSSLRSSLSALLSSQLATAEADVQRAEERLQAGWTRVHEWQAALGEPLREAKKRGDGPLEVLVEEVERLREGMKGRMEERGKRVVQLHARLRELREVVGREWMGEEKSAKVEEEGKGWEEMNLRLERMSELEREVVRCEAEITRRQSLLNEHCSEIFTLRTELGIHSASSAPSSPSTSSLSAPDPMADPLDEEILWHLGVGEARQPRREISPTVENVERVAAKRKWLEDEKHARNSTIQQTYDKLYPLWTMLGVSEDEMEEFVNRWMGSTMDVVNAYQSELARMLLLKRHNLATFIARERALLTSLWDTLYLSHSQRLAHFPAYSISVEPTRVWNDKNGCEEELVSENVSEELLVAHEREREKWEGEVERARPVLGRLGRYFEVVEKGRELEAAAADPSRLMDKSRGAAMRLAQEAKDRKRVDKEKPKLEAELRALIPQWEAENGRPFLVNGVSFIEGLDEQIRQEEMEKENRKRAKLGASSSASSFSSQSSSHSSSSSRPLRAHHTGGSSLSSSSHTVAPLKRQMTGASVRSATSSTSTGPPPPKKVATTAPSSVARPRSRSVLGHRDDANPTPRATPAQPLKAQATGGTGAGGMRIPVGWGAGAGTTSAGAGVPATPLAGKGGVGGVGEGAGRLVPQATGGFRPRAG